MFNAFAILCFAFCFSVHADMQWGFGNLSVNRLDWDQGTEDKSTKRDFNYLELEGGAEFTWGDVYGFFDYENPGKPAADARTAFKGVLNRYLAQSRVSIYAHVYNFAAHGFSEQNRVLGLGYFYANGGLWFKPFVGFHDVSQTYFSGFNGYMAGWVAGYNFEILRQKFMLVNWHEHEFARHRNYAAGQGGSRVSHNGAASVWWNAATGFSLGGQWRYATDKLGTPGAMNAAILTVKYFL